MDAHVAQLRAERRRRYFIRGIAFAVASGICYGLYTGFLTLAESQDVWGEWFAGTPWGNGNPALSAFQITFVLAALAAGLNDIFSGIWSLIVCAKNRQLGDLFKTMRTKPGIIMMICASSISDGIMFGVLFYVFCKLVSRRFREISRTTLLVAFLFLVRIVLNATL